MMERFGMVLRWIAAFGLLLVNLSFAIPAQARIGWDDDWCESEENPGELVPCCTACWIFCECTLPPPLDR